MWIWFLKRRFKSLQQGKSQRLIYFEFPILVITANLCICAVIGLKLVMYSAFWFCSTRWRHRRTNGGIPRGNTAHETNWVSPEHIELIGLLYYDKSHVSCGRVCKEWGFTSVPQEAKTAGKANLASKFRKPVYLPKLCCLLI